MKNRSKTTSNYITTTKIATVEKPSSPKNLPSVPSIGESSSPEVNTEKLNNSLGKEGYKLEELKKFARNYSLPVSGTKSQLVERIKKHLKI